MRKKNKLRIILMWMLSLTLILSVNFSVFASNQNITQSDIKISSLHDEEGLSLNATSLSTDSVNLHNRKNASSLASREQEVVGEFTYHTNYLNSSFTMPLASCLSLHTIISEREASSICAISCNSAFLSSSVPCMVFNN